MCLLGEHTYINECFVTVHTKIPACIQYFSTHFVSQLQYIFICDLSCVIYNLSSFINYILISIQKFTQFEIH